MGNFLNGKASIGMGDWTNDHIQFINVITAHMFGSGHRDFECPVLHLPNCAANPADRIPLSLIRAVKKHLVHHGLYNEQSHQASNLKGIFHQMYLYPRWILTSLSGGSHLSQDLITTCISLSLDLSRDLFQDSQAPLFYQFNYRVLSSNK